MPQSVLTYQGGMSKDVSYLKRNQSTYEDARNFRYVTDSGSSTGAIVNERGTRSEFSFPTLFPTYTLTLGTTVTIDGVTVDLDGDNATNQITTLSTIFATQIAAGEFNFYVQGDNIILVILDSGTTVTGGTQITSTYTTVYPIGWTHMNDRIIIFTTADQGDGQIWLVDYNEQTNTVTNLNADNNLTASVHLIYNGLLDFSTETAITKAIARYENDCIGRVYWTDNTNPVRSINVLEPNGVFGLSADDIDLTDAISLSQPTITDISSGGAIPYGSKLQMGYRLIGNGNQTAISPLTNLLPMYGPNDEGEYIDIKGAAASTGANKAISFSISNIDTTFEQIEYIFVLYEVEDAPTVYSYIETIPDNGIVNGTFTNNEEGLTTLSLAELNAVPSDFSIAKDITVKENRLIAANLRTSTFEITDEEFDARAYRFDSTGTSVVYQSNGTSDTIPADFSLDSTHDAINTFNTPNDPNFGEYKYQSDGVTLGGEGVNISYSFITQQLIGDEERNQTIPWTGVQTQQDVSFQASPNAVANTASNQYNGYASPFVTQYYTGYQRDEVYRFAIVFYSTKGEVSFAKWIGDIKMPNYCEKPITEGSVFDNSGNFDTCYVNALGVEFTVNIPAAVQAKIQGYEIVRLERDYQDQSRIGGGLMMPVNMSDGTIYNTTVFAGGEPTGSFNLGTSTVGHRLRKFIFPPRLVVGASDYEFEEGDFLRIEAGYQLSDGNDLGTDTFADEHVFKYVSPTASGIGIIDVRKLYNPTCYDTPIEVNIDKERIVGFPTNNGSFTLSAAGMDIPDFSTFENTNNGDKKGSFTMLLFLENDFDLPALGGLNDWQTPYATYCRNIANQYGGNTYEARSFNQYVSTGSVVFTDSSDTVKVYGGDTYVSMFTHETFADIGNGDAAEDFSQGIAFACETPFNPELSHNRYFQKDRENPAISQDDFEGSIGDDGLYERTYNPVYSQDSSAKENYVGSNFLVNTKNEFPFTVWASELKVNGQLVDGWGQFLVNNQLDVEGIYGPINAIQTFKDKVFFYQDQAFGVVTIDERVAISDENGTELVIGTGDVVADYGYVSRHTGTLHRQAVVPSENYIYHFDTRQKKLFQYSIGHKSPLSDIKGLNAYFHDNVSLTTIENVDNPTSLTTASNILGAYDSRYNRVLFTFKSPTFNETISFNELTNNFTSFHDYQPKLYLSTGRKLLSVSPFNNDTIHQHDLGDYGVFYGQTQSPSTITFIANAGNHFVKRWDNLEWLSELYDTDGNALSETYERLTISNDYQTTGEITLLPDFVKRRFRTWRHTVQRNINPDGVNDRIRNPWVRLKLEKDNDKNARFISHDFVVHYMPHVINDYSV